MIYIDTSAALQTIVQEESSSQVRALFDRSEPMVASRLLDVELHSAAARRGVPADPIAQVLDRVALISLDDDIIDRAIALRSGLRTLDALHLASALSVADTVTSFLAFDDELNLAARRHGLALHPASAP